MTKLLSLLKKAQSNPVIERAEHTLYQAAFGAFVATLAGTHGDVRVAVTAAVAAALSAGKTLLFPPGTK
jgi:hypothetical protein